MATKILPSADDTDQIGQSTENGDASNLRWKGIFSDLRVEGDLTVTGDTTTVSSTNTTITDTLIELNSGDTDANTNDIGIIMERGTTGDNAAIIWDESADKFVVGTTTATGSSTGDLAVTTGTLVANLDSDSTLTSVKVDTDLSDSNGNEVLGVTATAAAVNHLSLANAAIGSNPTVTAAGEDANVGIDFQLKGTGSFDVHGTSDTSAQIKLYEDTTDGNQYIGLKAASIGTSYTLTLPNGAPGTDGLSLVANQDGTCSWNTVSAGGLEDSSITLAKFADIDGFSVIGNVTSAVGADNTPEEVRIYDEDTMASDSDTALATQQSIKAYVDNSVSGIAGLTSTAAELNILDGATVSTAELNILDGVTADANELNILDGVTATTADLNILDGVTATTDELNILDGVTADATEINKLDGVTATTAELNILDGVTATAAELNIVDGALAATIVNSKAVVYGAQGQVNASEIQLAGVSVTASAAELNILDGVTATTDELNILDGVTATTAELNILDGVTATAAELNILDGVTATAAELNILDGVTADANELNILDGVTASTAELNILDGVTATAAELNILDGVTADANELNILDGVTATTAELNILDGVTATTAELNILDGVTATTAELNLVDGSSAGTIVNNKAVIYSADGQVNATSLAIGGAAVTSSAAELNILDGVTATSAELNILDGVTASTAEINKLDGVTATTDDLNILDGVTATAAELNILDGVTATATELNILDGVTADANELNILDGVTATTAELNLVDGSVAGTIVNSKAVIYSADGKVNASGLQISGTDISATPGEINILDGVTASTAELNILDGVTATATDLNILSGVTATTAELNILDGVTATTAELNILDGVTATTAELNILDGVTADANELNILDGVTATTAELNILDGVTATAAEINYNDITALGTTEASKVVTTDANGDIAALTGSLTITGDGHGITVNNGDVNARNGQFSGSLQVNDKLNLSGSVATIGATTLKMDDSLIELNYLGSNASSSRDLGIFGRVDSSTGKYQGLIFDGSDSHWKLISTTTYPGADNYITGTTPSVLDVDSVVLLKDAPATSHGSDGDKEGMIAADSSYFYYCTANYTDGVADIWKRVALSIDTW